MNNVHKLIILIFNIYYSFSQLLWTPCGEMHEDEHLNFNNRHRTYSNNVNFKKLIHNFLHLDNR